MAGRYVNSKCKTALMDFRYALKSALCDALFWKEKDKSIVVLCIGTDKATGDSLGPLVGYKLSRLPKRKNVTVYGTLDNPVHAINLADTVKEIYEEHKDPFIIAIDASLGKTEHIGYITVGKGSISPGAGVKKNLGEIGDVFITGIVNLNGFVEISRLQSTRLSLVMNIADIVSVGIWETLSF
mgnify:FL=1